MAQYDLVLIQNTATPGVDFEEKIVNLNKGDLLSAIATTKVPTVLAAGTDGYILVRDDNEVTGLKWVPIVGTVLEGNDALILKGTIGAGGTHTISAFNALTTYNAGWTYRVIEAGTIRGVVCQIGDLVVVLVDRAGSGNLDSDFTVAQTNIDGAVVGPASAVDGDIVLFDSTTGKLIKSSGVGLATKRAEWVSAPASKTASGTAGQEAYDSNYHYVCVATNTWRRSALAQWT